MIYESMADGRSAIKTYQGEGVSQQIKSHHSQIYVGKQVPPIRQDENPGIRNGKTESPMQTHAVCVEPYDNYQTLDPLSESILTASLATAEIPA